MQYHATKIHVRHTNPQTYTQTKTIHTKHSDTYLNTHTVIQIALKLSQT